MVGSMAEPHAPAERTASAAPLTAEELAAFRGLLKSGALLRREAGRVLAENSDLTGVQYEILRHLGSESAGLRMHELADRCVHSRSGLTYQVTQLERMGLVARCTADNNERAVIAKLTESGEEMHEKLRRVHTELLRETFFTHLNDEEMRTLTTITQRICRGIEAGLEESN